MSRARVGVRARRVLAPSPHPHRLPQGNRTRIEHSLLSGIWRAERFAYPPPHCGEQNPDRNKDPFAGIWRGASSAGSGVGARARRVSTRTEQHRSCGGTQRELGAALSATWRVWRVRRVRRGELPSGGSRSWLGAAPNTGIRHGHFPIKLGAARTATRRVWRVRRGERPNGGAQKIWKRRHSYTTDYYLGTALLLHC